MNGLNFDHYYLGGLHSAYVRGDALRDRARVRGSCGRVSEDSRSSRPSWAPDPIGALAHVQLGRAFALIGRHDQGEGCICRISSLSGKTRTPTSRFSDKPRRNTPSCLDRKSRARQKFSLSIPAIRTTRQQNNAIPEAFPEEAGGSTFAERITGTGTTHGRIFQDTRANRLRDLRTRSRRVDPLAFDERESRSVVPRVRDGDRLLPGG